MSKVKSQLQNVNLSSQVGMCIVQLGLIIREQNDRKFRFGTQLLHSKCMNIIRSLGLISPSSWTKWATNN